MMDHAKTIIHYWFNGMQRNQKNTLFFGLSFCNKRTANDLEKQKGFSNFFQTSKIAVAMLMLLRPFVSIFTWSQLSITSIYIHIFFFQELAVFMVFSASKFYGHGCCPSNPSKFQVTWPPCKYSKTMNRIDRYYYI